MGVGYMNKKILYILLLLTLTGHAKSSDVSIDPIEESDNGDSTNR